VLPNYEQPLKELLAQLGSTHPRYLEVLTYQHRLQENYVRAKKYGDTETLRAERSQIVEQLNRVALETLGLSFNELSQAAVTGEPAGLPEEQDEVAPEPPSLVPQYTIDDLQARILIALRDPLWQAVAAIIAALTLMVTIWAIQSSSNAAGAFTESTPGSFAPMVNPDSPSNQIPTAEPFAVRFIAFDPPSPSSSDAVKIFACAGGYNGVGITLKVSVNNAPDGSDLGDWQLLKELGVPCFGQADAPVWQPGTYLVKVEAKGPADPHWTYPAALTATYILEPKNE
jgi:hypothetical protein